MTDTATTTPPEIGGIGHSVKRVEDARLIEGQGNFLDDIALPGMLHMALVRSPVAHARINGIDTEAASAVEGVVAVVTGDLMAAHNLAWMPTLSGDTQAVLVTDKVRYRARRWPPFIATDPYVAADAAELVDVDYEMLDAITTPQQALADGAELIRDEKEDQTDNLAYIWETGDEAATEAAFASRRPGGVADHPLPALAPVAAGDVRDRGRRQLGDRPGHRLHDVAGAARPPDAVRAGGRAARAEHPHRQPRHRRRLRQQGAHLSRLRGGHRGQPADRPAGQVGGDPHRQPDLHRVRARLLHDRRVGPLRRRPHPGHAGGHAVGPGRLLLRRPADPATGPGCSTSAPAATTSARPTSSAEARSPTRRLVGWPTGARSASPRRRT